MKLLLIGERYSNNLGDGIIFDTVEKICRSNFKKVEIVSLDISGNTHYKEDNCEKNKYNIKYRKIRKILSKYKRKIFLKKELLNIDVNSIDIAIYVGGQLFSNYFSGQIYSITKYLNKKNIPIIFNSCGFGKNSKKSLSLLNKALNLKKVSAISIRDNYDYFKKNFIINKNISLTVDPVYNLDKFYKKEDSNKKNIVGIGLMEPNLYSHNNIDLKEEDYQAMIKIIIKNVKNNNLEWEFFCNGNIEDYNYINKICKDLNIPTSKISKRPIYPNELINLIAKYDKIISFRLHSHIVARSLNIPTFGFYWDDKVKEFASLFSDCNKNFINLSKINYNFFNESINDFLKSREKPKKQFLNSRKSSVDFLIENIKKEMNVNE